MHPVIVEIGPLTIRWYGVMIASACFLGLLLAIKEAERKGISKGIVQSYFFYAIIGGVIGARLYYMAFAESSKFLTDPFSVFAIQKGGLAIHGAILGGFLVTIIFTKIQGIPFWKFADTLAPSLILGQAIGRIGCFLNGDAHGLPTNLPWGMVYSPASYAGQMFPGRPLHPTQLYEMVINLAIFIILWKLRKKLKVEGRLFLLYVMMYSIGRIFVEYFRADKLIYFGSVSAAQSVGIVGIALSLVFMFVARGKSKFSK